jgi:hypothetical protein
MPWEKEVGAELSCAPKGNSTTHYGEHKYKPSSRPTQEQTRAAKALWGEPSPAGDFPVITASNWVRRQQGTFEGFADFVISTDIGDFTLRSCAIHQKDGSRWVSLPGRPVLGRDGKQLLTPKTQKPSWSPTVEIKDAAARERFRRAALAAIDELTGRGEP